MKRELFIHFSFWFAFFIVVALIKQYLNISSWPFWVGGLMGIFLPDLDHIIYVLFLKPQELTSQRFGFLMNKREVGRSISLLYETRSERKSLIFHTVLFQLIFLILTFWMVSSSASLFGKGLVLSFSLHLNVDQIMDLVDLKSFENWLKASPIYLDLQKAKIYWTASFLLICVLGFLM